MTLSKVELPSNRKFGFFFTGVFLVIAVWFWYNDSVTAASTFAALMSVFLLITLVKVDVLLPLNKLWMSFGLLLGMIVSPIVLGFIFFLIFTPIALTMRLFRRDELRLRFRNKSSHWIKREVPAQPESFQNQF
jgi:hypothetical protein